MGIAVATAMAAPTGMQWGVLPGAVAWPLETATVGERPGAPVARAWPLADNGYFMCGINGCILRDQHQGSCLFPDLGSRRRRSTSFLEATSTAPQSLVCCGAMQNVRSGCKTT